MIVSLRFIGLLEDNIIHVRIISVLIRAVIIFMFFNLVSHPFIRI